jgi:hypothetical protein
VVVVVFIIASGFVPYVVALKVSRTPYTTTETTSIAYSAVQTKTQPVASTYTVVSTEQSITTETSQPFYIGPQSLNCNYYSDSSTYLNAGTDVSVSYAASANLYMYVFDSAEFSAYSGSSSTTSPNVAEIDNQASGSTSFVISQSDTYYLVLWYKPQFFGCINAQAIGITSTSSSASYQTTVNYYVTQTSTAVSYTTTITTATFYSASSHTTVLTSNSTKTCTVGWLQAAISSC